MTQWLVIGISGVTCGGKTTLANKLLNFFQDHKNERFGNTNGIIIGDSVLVSQDNYFRPEDDERHEVITQLNHINWEILTALDMDRMLNDVRSILKDDCFFYNCNCHRTNSNSNACFEGHRQPAQSASKQMKSTFQNKVNILIIEGFLIFHHPQLLQIFQIKFHLHLPYEKCFERRKLRVYEPPDVTGYYEMCVWPTYEQRFDEIKDRKDILMLNGDLCKDRIFKFVLNCICGTL